jgi:hypothetical protein
MGSKSTLKPADDVDGLRLFALGRIPRCTRCPRYQALVAAHTTGSGCGPGLPLVPSFCLHQVCAPLVDHYRRARRAETRPHVVACGY